jgi:predicted DNA-binding transcriptional regulator AlpA
MSERELAYFLGLSAPTLFRLRRDGTGPAYVRLSPRRIAYRRSVVEEWVKAKEETQLKNGLEELGLEELNDDAATLRHK